MTKLLHRDYDEDKWHTEFQRNLSKALKAAEKLLRDHEQSIVVEHGDVLYTVYLDENGFLKTERLQ